MYYFVSYYFVHARHCGSLLEKSSGRHMSMTVCGVRWGKRSAVTVYSSRDMVCSCETLWITASKVKWRRHMSMTVRGVRWGKRSVMTVIFPSRYGRARSYPVSSVQMVYKEQVITVRITFGSWYKRQAWFSPQTRVWSPIKSMLRKFSHTTNENRGIASENQTTIPLLCFYAKVIPKFLKTKNKLYSCFHNVTIIKFREIALRIQI